MSLPRAVFVAFVALILTTPFPLSAQSREPVPTPVQVSFPASQPRPEVGRFAFYSGEADAVGVVFAIPPSTVFSPSRVAVKVTGGNGPLQLRLRNDLSDRWDRTETTDASGFVEIKYRTEGTASLLVQTPEPGVRRTFDIVFYQGREVPVHRLMQTPFLTPEQAAARGPATQAPSSAGGAAPPPAAAAAEATEPAEAPGTPVVLWVIAGLLAVLIAMGGLLLARRKS